MDDLIRINFSNTRYLETQSLFFNEVQEVINCVLARNVLLLG